MGTSILVTGAGGFIGARLRQALVADGQSCRRLVRGGAAVPDSVVADFHDPDSLRSACVGMATVFHCAGFAHAFASSDADSHWRINFEATRNFIESAGRADVRSFVFLSSVKAMAEPGDDCVDEDWPGDPASPYGRAKRAAEEAVLEVGAKFGMHVVNLRLAMVYGRGGRGNLERMARGIRAGWFPPLPETGNRRSLVHVDDVVNIMRFVADAPAANGRAYIVADACAYSGHQLYDALRAALAVSPAPTFAVPSGVLRAAGGIGDVIGRLLGRPLPLNSEIVSRLLDSACYSPARIERELGWRARIGLAEGLREMIG